MAGKDKSIAGAIEAGVLSTEPFSSPEPLGPRMARNENLSIVGYAFRGPSVDGTFSEIFRFRLTKLSKCFC